MSFATEPKTARFARRLSPLSLLSLGAWLALFTACTESPSVGPDDIGYEEIRIDAFPHYWAERLHSADSVDGNDAFEFYDDSTGRIVTRFSLPNEDRLGELPPHTIDSAYGVVFTAKRPPGEFSCMVTETAYLAQTGSGAIWVEERVRHPDEGYVLVAALNRVPSTPVKRPAYCEYIEGLGFHVPSFQGFGTILIRY